MAQRAVNRLASLISTLGHPAMLMSLAVVFAPVRHVSPNQSAATWLVPLLIVAIGLAFAFWKVHRGQWQHVDASVPKERTQLNVFMLCVLVGASALCWFGLGQMALALGLAASSVILASALILARWLKLSLHVSFAALAACVLVSDYLSIAVAAGSIILITWSRLQLQRHTWSDVVAGLSVGLLTGTGWRLVVW